MAMRGFWLRSVGRPAGRPAALVLAADVRLDDQDALPPSDHDHHRFGADGAREICESMCCTRNRCSAGPPPRASGWPHAGWGGDEGISSHGLM